MSQATLFDPQDQGLRRADSPRSGYNARNGSKSSKRAAIAIAPTSGTQRFRILEVIVYSGKRGRTQWEIVDMANVLRSSACARVKELEEGHFIRKHGERTGPRGTSESVYYALDRGERAIK